MNEPITKLFKDFKVGDTAEFYVQISPELITEFAEVSGDKNPLHTEVEHAKSMGFLDQVSHGMLAGALFSRLMGMYLPGKYSLCLKQNLNFHKPVYPGTEVKVFGEIINKTDSFNALSISLELLDRQNGTVYVKGGALVKVLK